MACAGNYHEKFVVLLAGRYGQFLVGITSEIERVCLLSVENHDCIFNLSGTAHQREVDPRNRRCRVSSAVGIERAGMIAAFGLVVVEIVAQKLWSVIGQYFSRWRPS